MAKPELLHSISTLSNQIDRLLEQQKKLQQRINFLETNNEELRKQHESDQLMLAKAQKDIEFLSVSHRLAASPEALLEARGKISMLIRNIDSCIRMIKED